MKNNFLKFNQKLTNGTKERLITPTLNYWSKKLTYEKIILLLSLMLILFIGVYYVILNPINIKIQQQQYTLEQLERLNDRLLAVSPSYSSKNKQANTAMETDERSLSVIIDQSAQKKGIIIKQIRNIDNQVQLNIEETQFNILLSWINQLHEQHNISVNHINITATDTPGVVNIQRIVFSYQSP